MRSRWLTFVIIASLLACGGCAGVPDAPAQELPPGLSSEEGGPSEPDPAAAAEPSQQLSPEPLPESSPEPTPEPTPEPIVITVSNIADTAPELIALLDDVAEKYNCVAVSLAVFDGVSEFSTYQYGLADKSEGRVVNENTKFRIASLSKVAAGIVAMSLVEQGVLDLDEDISTYLGYTVRNPNSTRTAITSRMLLQHTSSLYDEGSFQSGTSVFSKTTLQSFLTSKDVFKNRRPGSAHTYSNLGYAVLGAVCEGASGKPFGALADEVLFAPLGIDGAFLPHYMRSDDIASLYNSSHSLRRSLQAQLDYKDSGSPGLEFSTALGNLTISALDYARILVMLANGGEYDGVRILSEESVREMHETNVSAGSYQQGLSVRFLENAFMGEGMYWHTGSAYGLYSQFFYCTDTGRVVVVVTTGTAGARESNRTVKVCNELSEIAW